MVAYGYNNFLWNTDWTVWMRNYQEYPKEYLQVLEHFLHKSNDYVLHGTFGSLWALRLTFYKYFNAVKDAYNDSSDDRRLEDLVRIIKVITISTEPTTGNYNSKAKLIFKLDPLIKAMRKVSPTKVRNL